MIRYEIERELFDGDLQAEGFTKLFGMINTNNI